jgi:hypothetical protein
MAELFVINDFLGLVEGTSAPAGAFVPGSRGSGMESNLSRGFQIDNLGKVWKTHGVASVGQLFTDSPASVAKYRELFGVYCWRDAVGGSLLVLSGAFGTCISCVGDPTSASWLKFVDLSIEDDLDDLCISPPSTSSTGVSEALFTDFAEWGGRLYACNGLDWPIRLESVYYTHKSRFYSPMGVHCASLASDIDGALTTYGGTLVEESRPTQYILAVTSRYGDGPPVAFSKTFTDAWSASTPDGISKAGKSAIIYRDSWAHNWSPLWDGVKIYRVPEGSMVGQYVGFLPAVPKASFLDVVTSDGLDELGYPVPTDDQLPSNFRLLCGHEDRMFAAGGYGNPNRLSCSKAGYPDVWPALNELRMAGSRSTSRITRLLSLNGGLYVFLDSGILRLSGVSPDNYTFQPVSDSVGCIAPKSLFPVGNGYAFLSKDGIYFFDGSSLQKVVSLSLHGCKGLEFACGASRDQYYYLSYRDDTARRETSESGSFSNHTYVVNMTNGRMGLLDDVAFDHSTYVGGGRSLTIGLEGS